MSDDTTDGGRASTGESYRRRDVLGALAATGALALAGCSSDSDGNGGDGGVTPTGASGGNGQSQSTLSGQRAGSTQTPDSASGGDGQSASCSSPSFTYTTRTFSPMGMTGKFTASVPEGARVISGSGFNMAIPYGAGRADSIVVTGTNSPVGTVKSAGDALSQSETEVTDQYDLAVSGARAFRQIQREGKRVVVVLLPADEGYYRLQVSIGNRACPSATNAAATKLINSLKPA